MECEVFVVMTYIRFQRHEKEGKYQKKRNYFESMRFHELIVLYFHNKPEQQSNEYPIDTKNDKIMFFQESNQQLY